MRFMNLTDLPVAQNNMISKYKLCIVPVRSFHLYACDTQSKRQMLSPKAGKRLATANMSHCSEEKNSEIINYCPNNQLNMIKKLAQKYKLT